MSNSRFWVVGGEYRSLEFDEIIDGSQQLIGPFGERAAAERSWRDVSEQNRSRCTVRFTIVKEK